ncbi:SDR family oxidoreductase [Candidatus Microgenomates bacterium]|nr:SDR family oxidoreductase [Candidatus Microgenomates bacterium]
MQTVLVAGGGGFIGSHLCGALVADGYRVMAVDNFITGNKKNIEPLLNNKQFVLIEDDIINENSRLRQGFGGQAKLNYIFHLASPASPNKKSPRSYISHPIETMLANSLGTKNLLDLAGEHGAAFLYASSSEVYGDPLVSPQNEDYFGNVNSIGPRSVYDEGKRFSEAMTMAYSRTHNVNVRIVRIFNTYGPKMAADDGRVVSNFITQALENKPITIYGSGSQTRSFCYIDDMVDGLIKAMFSDKSRGEVINLGNPQELPIIELAKLIKKLTNSQSELIHGELPQDDPQKRKPDITRAKRLLSFLPKVPIEEGLAKTIQYFKESSL